MKNLQKHLSIIANTKSNVARPILQNVHYSQEHQALFVTDSYRLLKFNTNVSHSFNINPMTFELLDESAPYPKVNSLIPTNSNEVIHLDSSYITPILIKLLKIYKTSILTVSVNYDSKQIEIHNKESFIVSIPYEGSQGKEPISSFMNAKYLADMFTFMLDYHKSKPSTIAISYLTPLKPITFSSLEYTYLITPFRKNTI